MNARPVNGTPDPSGAVGPPPVDPRHNPDPVDILARTIWGETRGWNVRGTEAMAALIINRVGHSIFQDGWWWGDDVVGVCLKPWQFSCWNPGDPDLPRLLTVQPGDRRFDICRRIARRAIAGTLADPTAGATRYHRRNVAPAWAREHPPSARIGRHFFYNHTE